MTIFKSTRRSFFHAAALLVSPFLAGSSQAFAADPQPPLMAYVGTFSSPLKDTLPTQVDLPPGNGRGGATDCR